MTAKIKTTRNASRKTTAKVTTAAKVAGAPVPVTAPADERLASALDRAAFLQEHKIAEQDWSAEITTARIGAGGHKPVDGCRPTWWASGGSGTPGRPRRPT
jgi:hypothetical protein